MRTQQRLLHGLVGVGLGAEQRHAQAAEDHVMSSRAGRDRLAVLTALNELDDRIGHHHRYRSLHLDLHVRPDGRFVTADLRNRLTGWIC